MAATSPNTNAKSGVGWRTEDDPISGSGILLGHAIAHELGHLLLGAHEHANFGIMRHLWRREEIEAALRGTLFFLPHEAARLRAEILLRAAR